jgi:hypothetical protein
MLTQENGGITAWYVLSAISQLSLELKTGQNFYGKRSVYSGLAQHGLLAPERGTRATKRNKMLALADILTMCEENGLDVGAVGTSAQNRLTLRKHLTTWSSPPMIDLSHQLPEGTRSWPAPTASFRSPSAAPRDDRSPRTVTDVPSVSVRAPPLVGVRLPSRHDRGPVQDRPAWQHDRS